MPPRRESGVRLLSNGEEGTIRVAVADDQRLFTKGLSGLVDMLPGVEVVGVAFDGEEAVALCREKEPDVVLMDISMPKMDGISATREIKDLLPQTSVIILTGHEEDEHIFEGIKAGAQGYLLKDSEPEDLSRAIRTVHAGDTIIAPDLAQKMLTTFEGGRSGSSRLAPPPLTERELGVIRALARGMSDRQIARSLDISEKTVRNPPPRRSVRPCPGAARSGCSRRPRSRTSRRSSDWPSRGRARRGCRRPPGRIRRPRRW